ncbi:MAG TPA: hypothetical protein VFL85_04920 [Candidatus Saccharimonadales bacterium]|nr:hypothetical protein [Candidatus Saccharimonadales bacterium]
MAIRVAAANTQERLGIPGQADVDAYLKLDADVLGFSDAYWLGNPLHGARAEVAEASLEQFRHEGYRDISVNYGDRAGHYPGRYLVGLSRIAGTEFGGTKAGMYNAVDMRVPDTESGRSLRVLVWHGDDQFEDNRQLMADALLNDVSPDEPTVIAGDENATYGTYPLERLLKSKAAKWMIERYAADKPPRNEHEERYGRPSMPKRAIGMVDGGTRQRFTAAGFRDADHRHRPTFPARMPLLQLDRIACNWLVAASDFRRHKTGASDHLAISALLRIRS